jgi:hypothetical protein
MIAEKKEKKKKVWIIKAQKIHVEIIDDKIY